MKKLSPFTIILIAFLLVVALICVGLVLNSREKSSPDATTTAVVTTKPSGGQDNEVSAGDIFS